MSTQPNVVFIFSDQQRYDTLRCYGNDWINVPRLNALAGRVVRIRARVCRAARLHARAFHHRNRLVSPRRRPHREQDGTAARPQERPPKCRRTPTIPAGSANGTSATTLSASMDSTSGYPPRTDTARNTPAANTERR